METLYVILVKSKKIDVTRFGKDWPADPKIKSREGSKPIDKLIEQTIRAGDAFTKIKRRSLRFTDKKKGYVEEAGPEDQEGGEAEAEVSDAGDGGE